MVEIAGCEDGENDKTGEAPDDVLVAALAAGENDALAELFSRHRATVFRVGMKVLGDPGEAEDLTQIVFFEVFRHAAKFDASRGNAKTWILTIAYSRSFHYRESLLRRGFYHWEPFDDVVHSVAALDRSTVAHIESTDLDDRLQDALGALAEDQRRVIHRVCFEGWTLREVASESGESFANVRHRYYRGLKKMRTLVSAAKPELARFVASCRPHGATKR